MKRLKRPVSLVVVKGFDGTSCGVPLAKSTLLTAIILDEDPRTTGAISLHGQHLGTHQARFAEKCIVSPDTHECGVIDSVKDRGVDTFNRGLVSGWRRRDAEGVRKPGAGRVFEEADDLVRSRDLKLGPFAILGPEEII